MFRINLVVKRRTYILRSVTFSENRIVFAVHMTVHRDKFLIIKPTRCTDFSNLFLKWNSTCFGQFLCPSSGAFHCTHSNEICHTACSQAFSRPVWYIPLLRTVKNSWWWTEELSETCRVSFQNEFEKLVHLVDFIIRKRIIYEIMWKNMLERERLQMTLYRVYQN